MTSSNLSKIFAAGVLATSVALVPLNLPASAQTGNDSGTSTAPRTDVSNTDYNNGDRDFDWGWLGLLGLAGLAGLAKKREEPVRYREHNEVTSSTLRR
ncbi:MAG TPA: WGxxGxxG family protein [Candidatus Obscuribacterales bacterium]